MKNGNSSWRKDIDKLKKERAISDNFLAIFFTQFFDEMEKVKETARENDINDFCYILSNLKQISQNQSYNPLRRTKEITKIVDQVIRRKPEIQPVKQ